MEYIDKKALRNALFNGEHNLYSWAEIEAKIDAIPSADVVPVVRCKDCKYSTDILYCRWHGFHTNNNDFCSNGAKP